MNNYPVLPLVIQNDAEKQRSWEGIQTPQDLAYYMARVLSVDQRNIATSYPDNAVMLIVGTLPNYMRALTSQEMGQYSLTAPQSGATWAIKV